jgi:probable rRNA maturation factor
MTVDINNESGSEADSTGLVRLAEFCLQQLRIHPQAELSILLVDPETMATYHEKYLNEPGPTDVLSFPMDELRPPGLDDEPPAGLLGDIVLCPEVTAKQAADHGRSAEDEARYLLIHGLLHLLGFDHATAEESSQMFGLTDKLLALWHDQPAQPAAGGRPDPAERS